VCVKIQFYYLVLIIRHVERLNVQYQIINSAYTCLLLLQAYNCLERSCIIWLYVLNAYVSGFYYFLINKLSHACYKVLLLGFVGAIVTVCDVLLCSISANILCKVMEDYLKRREFLLVIAGNWYITRLFDELVFGLLVIIYGSDRCLMLCRKLFNGNQTTLVSEMMSDFVNILLAFSVSVYCMPYSFIARLLE
jgi:hypothetical protein